MWVSDSTIVRYGMWVVKGIVQVHGQCVVGGIHNVLYLMVQSIFSCCLGPNDSGRALRRLLVWPYCPQTTAV
jgi:hypothetical protein